MLRIDEARDPPSCGRELAGAWLLCVLIAGLTFGVTTELHRKSPPGATSEAAGVRYASHSLEICRASPEPMANQQHAALRGSAVVTLNRSTPSC